MTDLPTLGGSPGSSDDPADPEDPPSGPPRPLPPPTLAERWAEARDRWALSPGRVAAIALGLLVAVGLGWWLLRPPPVPVDQTLPMATTTLAPAAPNPPAGADAVNPGAATPIADGGAPVLAHAAGAVTRPGVYQLGPGARVSDLLAAAGGTPPEADVDRLNLAAPVVDGSRVWVPRRGELAEPAPVISAPAPTVGPAPGTGGSNPGSASGGGTDTVVDLNTATAEQLDTLPGVGPSTAQSILDYRQEHGRFGSVDELIEVRGIGDAKLADLRDRVRV